MCRVVRGLVLACWLCIPLHAGGPSRGSMEEYRSTASEAAQRVAKVLKARNETSITVGTFSGPPILKTAIGPGLKLLIVQELSSRGITVVESDAKIGLTGIYSLVPNNFGAAKQLRIELRLTDENGVAVDEPVNAVTQPKSDDQEAPVVQIRNDQPAKKKNQFESILDTGSSPAAMAVALGLTANFDLIRREFDGADWRIGELDLADYVRKNPTAFLDGEGKKGEGKKTVLRSSPDSPLSLEVLVNGAPRELRLENGQPYVNLKKGETFRLRLKNGFQSYGISVVFTLDGVNSFSFSKMRKPDNLPKYTHWLFAPAETLELNGWHIDDQTVEEFKITDFAQSAAARIGSADPVGTINVVIRAVWPVAANAPADEQPRIEATGPPGVGFGTLRPQYVVPKNATGLTYGRVRSVMTIRYMKPE